MATHFSPNTAAKPNSPEASEYNLTTDDFFYLKMHSCHLMHTGTVAMHVHQHGLRDRVSHNDVDVVVRW